MTSESDLWRHLFRIRWRAGGVILAAAQASMVRFCCDVPVVFKKRNRCRDVRIEAIHRHGGQDRF